MNREPLGLYIFRFVMGFGLFAFMAMLYWSSVLLEEDMKQVQSQLTQINGKLAELKFSEVSTRTPVVQEKELNISTQMDSSLPNLLTTDPFYSKTLPDLLGPGFQPHGEIRSATIGKPDNLHPFSMWANVRGWISLCSVNNTQNLFGRYATFAPNMATRMELRQNADEEPEFWIFLRNDVYWHPLKKSFFSPNMHLAPMFFEKHQVTAHDFKFFYDAVMNPFVQDGGAISLRSYLKDIEEFRIVDDLTFVIRWKTKEFKDANGIPERRMKYIAKIWTGALQPLASFIYKYFPDGRKIVENDSDPETYRTHSVWAQNLPQHWAKNVIPSCGAWVFDGMSDREIRFQRNPDHFEPLEALMKTNVVNIKPSPDAIWQDFKAGMVDYYNIQPDQLVELENFLNSSQYKAQESKGEGIGRLDYVARMFTFVGWNQTNPLFSSNKVRRALTMGIDRARVIRQNLNGMGIETNGPFFKFSQAYDTSILPWPYNPIKARLLLEEEGWYDSDGDGIIDKEINGKRVPFRFALTYFVKNPQTKSICEYISTALKELGIDCLLNGMDMADLSASMDEKSFEAIFMGWGLSTPPEDPRQLWHSSGAQEKGSSNIVSFSNKEADAIIDALEYEYNPEKRIELYHRFNRIIHEEAPYTFMYIPKASLLYRNYVQNVFIPLDRQDLIPGADVAEPTSSIFWLNKG